MAARSRSISAENFTGAEEAGGAGEQGTGARAARELGRSWKVSPSIRVAAGEAVTLADIEGPGIVRHLWLTVHNRHWRGLVLRMYWDGEEAPSVEVPLGDFFCNGWCERSDIASLPVAVNPAGGFNSYWEMPFRSHARITVENLTPEEIGGLYYQVDHDLLELPEEIGYLHAQWRRSNPLPYMQDHTLLDGVRGRGQYVGTYLAWGSNNNAWWGEGEVKFFLDGDSEWPTICGTGTEDYFGGAYGFIEEGRYRPYSTSYLGFHQVIEPDGCERSQQRFGMYRWHVQDAIRFEEDLRVTIQALGWRSEGRYLPLQDDIASTAFWYQTEPHASFPTLPGRNGIEVI
jgi:hypothetical protein